MCSSFMLTKERKQYIDSCHNKLKVGEVRCIFPKDWLVNWENRRDIEQSVIDLLPILKSPGAHDSINSDLILNKDVLAMPLELAEHLFACYSHAPTSFKSKSFRYPPNAGIVFCCPETTPVTLRQCMDFNIIKGKVRVDLESNPQVILLAPKLSVASVFQIMSTHFHLNSMYKVFLRVPTSEDVQGPPVLCEMLPTEERMLEQILTFPHKNKIEFDVKRDPSLLRKVEDRRKNNENSNFSRLPPGNCEKLEHASSAPRENPRAVTKSDELGRNKENVHLTGVGKSAQNSSGPWSSAVDNICVQLGNRKMSVPANYCIATIFHQMLASQRSLLNKEGKYPQLYWREESDSVAKAITPDNLSNDVSSLGCHGTVIFTIQEEQIYEWDRRNELLWQGFRTRLIPQLLQMSEPVTQPRWSWRVGLENCGSACYLNAVLQSMCNLRCIREYFTDPSDLLTRIMDTESLLIGVDNQGRVINSTNWKDEPLREIVYWFVHMINFFRLGEYRSYNPSEILKHFCFKYAEFSQGQSNDAFVFVCHFLEQLDNFLQIPCDPNNGVGKNKSMIRDEFTGKEVNVGCCSQCTCKCRKEQPMRFLTLHLEPRTVCVHVVPSAPWIKIDKTHNVPIRVWVEVMNPAKTLRDLVRDAVSDDIISGQTLDKWTPYCVDADDFRFHQFLEWHNPVASVLSVNKILVLYQNATHFGEIYIPDPEFELKFSELPLLPLPTLASDSDVSRLEESLKRHDALLDLVQFLKRKGWPLSSSSPVRRVDISRLVSHKRVTIELEFNRPKYDRLESVWTEKPLMKVMSVDLVDVLQRYFHEKRVIPYQCGRCEKPTEHIVQPCLDPAPRVLMLHLKRCIDSHEGEIMYKIPVTCPVRLDLSQVMPTIPTSSTQAYRLVAAITRSGDDPKSGHYSAYCRTRRQDSPWPLIVDNKWIHFDDTNVTEGVTELPNKEIMILFYEVDT